MHQMSTLVNEGEGDQRLVNVDKFLLFPLKEYKYIIKNLAIGPRTLFFISFVKSYFPVNINPGFLAKYFCQRKPGGGGEGFNKCKHLSN